MSSPDYDLDEVFTALRQQAEQDPALLEVILTMYARKVQVDNQQSLYEQSIRTAEVRKAFSKLSKHQKLILRYVGERTLEIQAFLESTPSDEQQLLFEKGDDLALQALSYEELGVIWSRSELLKDSAKVYSSSACSTALTALEKRGLIEKWYHRYGRKGDYYRGFSQRACDGVKLTELGLHWFARDRNRSEDNKL